MDTRILLRHLLHSPHTSRTLLTPATRPQSRTFALLALPHARHLSMPTILRPSFWASMIPRPLRERAQSSLSREWNPATPYIVLALLVGSQAIQILWLKQERAVETRRAEVRIGLLREVVERVQRGEKVDVEGVLGVGSEREGEWGRLLKEIEEEELLFQSSEEKRRAREKAAAEEEKEKRREEREGNNGGNKSEEARVKVEELGGARFY